MAVRTPDLVKTITVMDNIGSEPGLVVFASVVCICSCSVSYHVKATQHQQASWPRL